MPQDNSEASIDFAAEILAIIRELVVGGNFKDQVKLDSGEERIHHVTFACGMGSLDSRKRYWDHFERPLPPWAAIEHPSHRTLLCNLATKLNLELPNEKPGA